MTQSFKDMLLLLGAGAQGEAVSFEHKPNIDEIRTLSHIQGVWPIVYSGLKKTYPDDEEVQRYNQECVAHMALNVRRTMFVRSTIKELEDNGISCCVLKGEALSHLYHQPYSRTSSDYDVLIDEKLEEKASQILIKKGYDVKPRPKNHQHFQAVHPVGGMLEIHIKMYSDATRDILLAGLVEYNEPYVSLETDDIEIKTLGATDNLIFLIAHFMKHFLTGEIQVRQILDILLYMQRYKGAYDNELYTGLMEKLNLTTFVNTLHGVGKMYFGIDTGADFDADLVDQLLSDAENVRFAKTPTNIHSEVSKAKFGKSETYNMYKAKHRYGGNRVLPDKNYLVAGGYKYAEHTLLIPVAWVHRFINIAFTFSKNPKAANKSTVNSDRMELAKKLGLY